MDIDQAIRGMVVRDLRAQLRNRGCNPAGGTDELRARLKDNMMETGNYSMNVGDGGGGSPMMYGASQGSTTADMVHGSLQNNYQRPGGMQNVGNFLTDKPSSRVLAPPGGGSQIVFGDYADPHTQPKIQRPPSYPSPIRIPQGPPPPSAYGASNMGPPQYGGSGMAPPQYGGGPPPSQFRGSTPPRYNGGNPAPQYGGSQGPQYGMGSVPGLPSHGGSPYGGMQPPMQQQQQPPQQQQQQYGSPYGMAPYGSSSNDVRGGSLSNNYSRPGGQQNVGNFLTDRPTSRVLAPPGGKSQISFG